ncbi:hypothetical protein, conserved [Eimeria tenella]|uniref:Uncharacterized protein n=1 Tax=Eimeria tenella TaxID=5802 RepID=U6KYA6_EIMTE|nr:hypothetical protein, conserved [Eimeria tenella]CDJ43162.1 hypothetical protein, conserved [Eimeria tenella]|eukprot:XP_013233912.1 hypothetical protein, conserved [Eimeria tenella]
MLIRGAAQFKEALFNGNPIAVATVGVIAFLLITLAARCKYAVRSSFPDSKQSTSKRRRRAPVGSSNSSTKQTASTSPPAQPKKQPKKTECETAASSNASVAKTKEEPQPNPLQLSGKPEDDGGDWLVVASKKKPRPKKA